jgi:teichuronic acid exporter
MSESVKSRISKGFFWNTIERFVVVAGQLILNIVLARMLSPKDFGLIGMVSIFFAISQAFIYSGMGEGLIQKKNKKKEDFSTVFVFNLFTSTLAYVLLFLFSPYIAEWFNEPRLELITRILGLNIVFIALSIVPRTKFQIEIDFKSLARVNVLSFLLSSLLAIILAYYNFGFWALVAQITSNSFFIFIFFLMTPKWSLSLKFSKESFKNLFNYGYKLLISGIYANVLREVYNIIIGKYFSASVLGFYVQAKRFSDSSSGTISSIIKIVSFPVLAEFQSDPIRMKSVMRRMLKTASFIVFPVMGVFVLLADPIISILFTVEWKPTIVILQWLCLARVLYPIHAINMNILKALGRSDLFLKVDLFKLPFFLIVLFITIPYGIKVMVMGQVVFSLIEMVINSYIPGLKLKYGFIAQVKDMFLPFLISVISSTATYFVTQQILNNFFKIGVGIVLMTFLYLSLSRLFKISELEEIITFKKNIK